MRKFHRFRDQEGVVVMERPEQNEQWKLSGDCSKCRRSSYCTKPCSANKRVNHQLMQSLVANKMNEMTGGAMKHIIDKTVRDYV